MALAWGVMNASCYKWLAQIVKTKVALTGGIVGGIGGFGGFIIPSAVLGPMADKDKRLAPISLLLFGILSAICIALNFYLNILERRAAR